MQIADTIGAREQLVQPPNKDHTRGGSIHVRHDIIGIMQGNHGFNDAQDRALEVIRAAESRLGDARFGGAWLDRSNELSPSIGIAAVDPSKADVDAILALPPRWGGASR